MKADALNRPHIRKLGDLIEGITYAVLTTREADGTLHSRPMRTEAVQRDGTLLFFTQSSSPKARELKLHPQVSLTYIGKDAVTCVAVAGHARLRRDPIKIKELWKPLYKVWFPKGLDDPDLVLLEVTIDRAEYWETPSSAVIRLFGAVKALATGKPIGECVGENKKLSFRKR